MTPRLRLLLLLVVAFLLPGVLSQEHDPSNIYGTKANGRYACPVCSPPVATSNRGAAFEANLLHFGDFLREMAAGNYSFGNDTFTSGGAEEDTVYGLATCLADTDMPDCAACLKGAAAELNATRCASRRDMVIWYPQCLVRYDNASFFGVADTSPARRFMVPNPFNFSDPVALDRARTSLAGRMLAAAAESPVRLAFDEEEVNSSTKAKLQGLAQCTEDLSLDQCRRCLAAHTVWLAACCAFMKGVRLNGASCYLRYELFAFAPGTPPSMEPFVESPSAPPPSASGGSSGSSSSSSRKKTRTFVLAGALGGVALVLLGACLIVISWYKKSRGSSGIESLLQLNQQQHPQRYSYAQVKRMTGSFAHKLGQGGNGTVYKGRLPSPDATDGGREVAVKMLKGAKVDGEEFINEVASISRTSHVNVVTLLGFCLQGSGSKSKRALVYEYMPNGSLERYTVGAGGCSSSSPSPTLSWEQLLDIAVGIARGLEYLHRGCNAHIVHFDIKPHNILLDAAFRPKISDFGLAKLCPQKESTISVSIAGARGTVGYIAPEVFSRQVRASVTSKSDVYSYGMMVLEMVGARRTIVNNGGGDPPAADSGTGASSSYFPECLYQDLDGFCASACGPEDASEAVRKMVIVGLWCIRMAPSDRPSMSRVLEMLNTATADLQLPPEGQR
ncbi:unnamed protein product [Urochloa humidicola]